MKNDETTLQQTRTIVDLDRRDGVGTAGTARTGRAPSAGATAAGRGSASAPRAASDAGAGAAGTTVTISAPPSTYGARAPQPGSGKVVARSGTGAKAGADIRPAEEDGRHLSATPFKADRSQRHIAEGRDDHGAIGR